MKIAKLWKKLGLKAMQDNKCTQKHIDETMLHMSRWVSYWKSRKDGKEALRVPGCRRHHLEEWRRHLIDQGFAIRTANKHLSTLRSALVLAEKHEIIDRRPRLEQLNEANANTKLFFRDEQIDSLFRVSEKLAWPNMEIGSGLWWMCSVIMYRTYGFRTQELIAYEKGKNPITWENITFDRECPNPDSDLTNDLGWLYYTPPKTAKRKPAPIYLPLTPFTHCALRVMEKLKQDDKDPIFNNKRNAERFYGEWYRWQELAEVAPKREGLKFTPYSLRKTCATYMNRHLPGLATAICRWGSGSEAKMAMDHYVNDSLILFEVAKAPMPQCFTEFVRSNAA